MSKWCNTCHREPYEGCQSNCPIFGLDFDELAKKHLEVINKLKYLKACAETVDAYEDDILDDYRQMAQSDMREIIDILLALNFGEEETK